MIYSLFGGFPNAKADYSMVPTVVFSHPVIGTIGETEAEARAKYGDANIKVYNSSFVNLWYGSYYGGGPGDKPMTRYKLVCLLPTEKIVGLHCFGKFLFNYNSIFVTDDILIHSIISTIFYY